jgi:hypothetical protein
MQSIGLLLPLLLAVTDDPSPSVQRYGYAGLGWLGLTGLTNSSGSPDSLMAGHLINNLAGSSSGSSRISSSSPASLTGLTGGSPDSVAADISRPDSLTVPRGQSGLGQQMQQQQQGMMQVHMQLVRLRAGSLGWHRELLLDVARRLVVGCEEGSWATAMPAATSLVMVSWDLSCK